MIVLGARNTETTDSQVKMMSLLPYPFLVMVDDGTIKMNGIGISFLYYSFFIGYSKIV